MIKNLVLIVFLSAEILANDANQSSLEMTINKTEMILQGQKDQIYTDKIDIYKALCGKEDAIACVKLAKFYQNTAPEQSVKYLQRACELGDKESCKK